jgi:serine/threonine protein kinase
MLSEVLGLLYYNVGDGTDIVLEYILSVQVVRKETFRSKWKSQKVLKWGDDCGHRTCEVESGLWGAEEQQLVVKWRALEGCRLDDQIDNEIALLIRSELPPHPHISLPTIIVLNLEQDSSSEKDMFIQPVALVFHHYGQNLSDFMTENCYRKNQPLSIPCIRNMLAQILKGLSHIHQHHIIHHDFCDKNIFIKSISNATSDGNIKEVELRIGDFGVSEYVNSVTGCGDPELRGMGRAQKWAPEQNPDSIVHITPQLDMYGFGFVGCSILWSGRNDLVKQSSVDLAELSKLMKNLSAPTVNKEEVIKDFLNESKTRPTLAKLFQMVLDDKVSSETAMENIYQHPPQIITNLLQLCKNTNPAHRPTPQHALSLILANSL